MRTGFLKRLLMIGGYILKKGVAVLFTKTSVKAMSVSPAFRSPFTDLTGCLVSHQWYGPCREMELKVMDCLEAYGLRRGKVKCDVLIKDFQECAGRRKQNARTLEMRQERLRQYKAGERSKEDLFIPIQPDSY